jgi:cysteine-rich repeat protein
MKLPKLLFFFLFAVNLLGIHRSAHAATFVVDRTDDDLSLAASACTALANDCSLRRAIIKANGLGGPDIITLPAGTYTLSRAGIDEDAGDTGDLDITHDLTINGAGANTTIVDGGGIDRVFHVVTGSGNVTINDVTITNGLNHSLSQGTESHGGGIQIASGTVALNRTIVRDNATAASIGNGAGIAIQGASTVVTVSRSTISGNTIGTGGARVSGGAGVSISDASVTITNTTIAGNKAEQGTSIGGTPGDTGNHGGGIELDGGTLTLNNDTITKNVSVSGTSTFGRAGGISVFSGTLTLRNTVIAGNTADISPDCEGTIVSKGHNLLGDATGCTGFPLDATDLTADPKLDPAGLKDNGGPTTTIALLSDSPAIDAGNDATCRNLDQRGIDRPVGLHCDIGAYEKGSCGDGFLEPEEGCDDGNNVSGDGCSAACVDETPGAICGNDVLETGEECDDGNVTDGDGCSSTCTVEATASVCGDGTLQGDEECDDGNLTDGDGCSSACQNETDGDTTGGGTGGSSGSGGCSLIR